MSIAVLIGVTSCVDTDATNTESESGSSATVTATGEPSGSGTETGSEIGACTAEPVADASFSYDFAEWQEYASSDWFTFDSEVPCSVVDVEAGADGLATVLDCTSEAGSFQGSMLIAPTDAGSVTWAPGQNVTLRIREETDLVNYAALELREMDGSLLLVALNSPTLSSSEFWNVDGALEPLTTVVDGERCGGQELDAVSVEFSGADDSLVLFGGQRGALPGDGTTSLAIDLEVARVAVCCSADFEFQLLIRRVET